MARVFLILALSLSLASSLWSAEIASALESGVSTSQLAQDAEKLRIANDSAKALVAFQELVKREPKNARYRAGLGNVYCQLNRLTEAKRELDLALRLNPKNVEVHKFLALYYIRRQDMKSARMEYRKLLALDPRHNCKCGGIQKLLGLEKEGVKPVKKVAR